MDFLGIGQNVNIKRSNGRVHSAVISKINNNSNSITVEWYETGETKGKEIEFEAIRELNANLFQEQQNAAPEPKKPTPGPQTNLSRNPTQNAIRMMNKAVPRQLNGRQTIVNVPVNNDQCDQQENIGQYESKLRKYRSGATTSQQTKPVPTAPAANPASRVSCVVKEVEKLKENREKRRTLQAEQKQEKVALMNLNPGNPHWETIAMIREYQSSVDFRPLVDGVPIENHQITVCVRKRPLSGKEMKGKDVDVISLPTKDSLIVHEPKTKVDLTKFLENHRFRFDYTFDEKCNNEIVYKYTAKPLVQIIFEGGMATCFAYGQTGSGKTHTMGGELNGKIQDCKNGIYAMVAKDIFNFRNHSRYSSLNLVVSASFFEIYIGKVFDLLSKKQKLRVLEDGKQQVQIVGLTEKVVDSAEEVLKLIQHGNNARTSGKTSVNSNSSRSHAVFQMVLRLTGSAKIYGKFSLIDLAGNERGKDTSSASRQTRMEGAEINKSLLCLKECIRALGKPSVHLPFRGSKLTQVLKDSFIGEKSKTCMIATISPGLYSCEHTLNTLRYADRVKELVVKDLGRSDDAEQMEIENAESEISDEFIYDEMLPQNAAILDLQKTEEIVVDQHKSFNEYLQHVLALSTKLYNETNYVDYDQEVYCQRGEEMFSQLIEYATLCKISMADFRAKLQNEEMLSCSTNEGKR